MPVVLSERAWIARENTGGINPPARQSPPARRSIGVRDASRGREMRPPRIKKAWSRVEGQGGFAHPCGVRPGVSFRTRGLQVSCRGLITPPAGHLSRQSCNHLDLLSSNRVVWAGYWRHPSSAAPDTRPVPVHLLRVSGDSKQPKPELTSLPQVGWIPDRLRCPRSVLQQTIMQHFRRPSQGKIEFDAMLGKSSPSTCPRRN